MICVDEVGTVAAQTLEFLRTSLKISSYDSSTMSVDVFVLGVLTVLAELSADSVVANKV